MEQRKTIDILHEVLNDRKTIERKLRALIRDQRVSATVLAVALSRLESFEDDIRNVIDEIEEK